MSNDTPLYPVPLTIEGSWMLHQFFGFDRQSFVKVSTAERRMRLRELKELLAHWNRDESTQTRLYAVAGHKADLMLLHLRNEARAVHEAERELRRIPISHLLTYKHSYLSVIELGLYESSMKTYRAMQEAGTAPHSEEWNAATGETLARQAEAMAPRLRPQLPDAKSICFYPMDRLRGEHKNWYTVPFEERARMMHDHGMIGRRYAGEVRQIISGSVGLDDWEWGVDLFADDPAVYKRLIYEMRFDEVSAVYAKFGQFFVGWHIPVEGIDDYFLD